MDIELNCETCEFVETVEEEWRAQDAAREHEAANPTHEVLVRRLE